MELLALVPGVAILGALTAIAGVVLAWWRERRSCQQPTALVEIIVTEDDGAVEKTATFRTPQEDAEAVLRRAKAAGRAEPGL
jgi:hypothetical protein